MLEKDASNPTGSMKINLEKVKAGRLESAVYFWCVFN